MTDCLKFGAFTLKEYVPMGSWVSRYWPELLVVVANFWPVWACSATTDDPGSDPSQSVLYAAGDFPGVHLPN